MTVEMDYINVQQEIAGKRARLGLLLNQATNAEPSEHESLGKSIKSANEDLSQLIDRAQNLKAQVEGSRLERDAMKAMRQPVGRQIAPDGGPSYGLSQTAYGTWGEAVIRANGEQGGSGMKTALLPAGTALVPTPIGVPVDDPRRARFLSELIPGTDAPGGHFAYLKQTSRINAAAVVAELAAKPESQYTLERVDGQTVTIAHLSNPVARQNLEDSPMVAQFVEQELRLGLNLAIDDRIIATLDAAATLVEGALGGDTLFTTRRAITRLEEREITPSTFVLNPRDWEQVEQEMTTVYAANSNLPAPTDVVRRSLHGYPVVVSNAVPQNTGWLGDFRGSALIYTTGGVRIDWSEAFQTGPGGDETGFTTNSVQWRCEGRFEIAITRPFAFVQIDLAGTGS